MQHKRFAGTCFPFVAVLIWISGMMYPAAAKDILVASEDDIDDALEQVQPGDVLVMQDGTWTDQEIDFAARGSEDAPITLRPQTPGGVTLTGKSELKISGRYLVVDGLQFRDGALRSSSHIVEFRGKLGNAEHCRLTNTVIDSYNPPEVDTRYFWVSLYGQYNRVDHCRFVNQAHSGVTVVAWLEGQPAHHRIDHNHFLDRPAGDGNGYETVRLGTSDQSNTNAFITVEYNLFERVDGEIEIISNKSNDNTFRFNTFRDSAGTLTLRHGHRATVEGNYFLGMDKPRSGGIRVMGEDNVVIHNYIADVDDRMDGAISMAAGIHNTPANGYQQVKRARIEHNTIVNVKGAGITFDWGIGERKRTLIPENLAIANNLIYSTHAPLLEGATQADWAWSDNIMFGAELGIEPVDGILQADPQLEKGSDGLWRPAADSPAAKQGAALPPVETQGDGAAASTAEAGDESPYVLPHPLTGDEVGPGWAD